MADASLTDEIINVYYEDAEQEFLAYCGRNDIPLGASGVLEDMVIAKLNQRGSEGLASQSYSGVSESYQTSYSETTKANLNRWRKLKTL